MIQDTAWSPRFVPSTTATAATSGEAIAGTDTTKFITPSLLPAATSYHAGPVVNGRAPRQGLVFDGTTGGSFTLTSAPSGSWSTDQTALIPTANPSSAIGLFSIGGAYSTDAAIAMYISAAGALIIEQETASPSSYRTATVSGFRAAYSGKTARIATTVSSSTLTIYVNGLPVSYSETTTGGSPPAWGATLGSATSYFGRLNSSQYYFNSALGPLYIYNRALSTSEVVALYESGAPAGADYNSASNINAATNWTNSGIPYTTFSGGSATGFTATSNGTGGQIANISPTTFPIVKGTKWRVTCTLTLNSGTAPSMSFGSSIVGNLASNVQQLSAGSNTIEFTVTSTTSSSTFYCYNNSTAANFSISGFTLTPLGLLLAPDAAQAGGGLVWYDTSGNAANITLPASGVSWNVPTSGYVTSGSSLNLSAGGTNQNITLTPSGTGKILLKLGDVDSQVNIEKRSTADIAFIGGNAAGSAARTLYFQGASVQFGIGGVGEVGRFAPTTGNFLIGGTIDGGQKLQVSGTAAISGGIVGTTTNDNAAAGIVGEYVSSTVGAGSAITLTTATAANLTSITLTPGDWDVVFVPHFWGAGGSVTGTQCVSSLSTTSATLDTTPDRLAQFPSVPTSGADLTVVIPATRFSVTSSTIIYGVVRSTFTVGTNKVYGVLSARRVR